jgi:HTH-type transcriptional regulator, sugar sensing transcriptional regulator
VFDDAATTHGVQRFVEAGEDARFVPELPLKLVIIDELIVMFGMEDPVAGSADLTIVVVEHPALAKVLKTAFDAIWDTGLTFDQAQDLLNSRKAATA